MIKCLKPSWIFMAKSAYAAISGKCFKFSLPSVSLISPTYAHKNKRTNTKKYHCLICIFWFFRAATLHLSTSPPASTPVPHYFTSRLISIQSDTLSDCPWCFILLHCVWYRDHLPTFDHRLAALALLQCLSVAVYNPAYSPSSDWFYISGKQGRNIPTQCNLLSVR